VKRERFVKPMHPAVAFLVIAACAVGLGLCCALGYLAVAKAVHP